MKRFFETPTIQDAEAYDRVSLKEWIAEVTTNPLATEYCNNLGTFHTVVNDPALISAGENIKVVLQSAAADVHLTYGAWAFAGAPGHRFIVDGLADVIRAQGGHIVTNARVGTVTIDEGQATGVVVNVGGEEREIKAVVKPTRKISAIIIRRNLAKTISRT